MRMSEKPLTMLEHKMVCCRSSCLLLTVSFLLNSQLLNMLLEYLLLLCYVCYDSNQRVNMPRIYNFSLLPECVRVPSRFGLRLAMPQK